MRVFLPAALIALCLCCGKLAYAADTYVISNEQSQITVTTGTSGLFGFLGHDHRIAAPVFSGEVVVEGERVSSLRMRIDTTALKETADFGEEDLRTIQTRLHEQVLETVKYPEIIFESREVTTVKQGANNYEIKIEGDLTLHGVTRRITIPATVRVSDTSARAVGKFELKRDEFQIRTEGAVGGTIQVANKLEVAFNIVAHRRAK